MATTVTLKNENLFVPMGPILLMRIQMVRLLPQLILTSASSNIKMGLKPIHMVQMQPEFRFPAELLQ